MAIAIPQQDREINGRLYRVDRGGKFHLNHPDLGWVDERVIPYDERPWRPLELTQPIAPGNVLTQLPEDETFWANGHYLVHRREMFNSDGALAGIHLSMRTVENDTRHDWREMQRVKNELCGPSWEAVELYPAESRVVDMANQFHLFAFPFELPIGFPAGIRSEGDNATGAVQRPGAGAEPIPAPADLRAAASAAGAPPHTFHQPGTACAGDHAARCCKAHGTHSMPHKGCVLR